MVLAVLLTTLASQGQVLILLIQPPITYGIAMEQTVVPMLLAPWVFQSMVLAVLLIMSVPQETALIRLILPLTTYGVAMESMVVAMLLAP
jgi:hypothetical protein